MIATRLLPALITALFDEDEAKRICKLPAVDPVMTSSDPVASVLALAESMEVVAAPEFAARWLATLGRKCIKIQHYNRERDETVERLISPQQIVFYRDNWYVDAWCHLRQGIRSFSVDAISGAEHTDEPAKEISKAALKEYFEKGYGIFSGSKVQWAKLKFTPTRARWVSNESWHPEQRSKFAEDGSYMLEVPYADDRELLMDVLRHGDEVEIMGPVALRKRIREILNSAAGKYY